MVDQSAVIDKALAGKDTTSAIVATVGKDWVISNQLAKHPGKAENFGWHFVGDSFGGQKWESAVTPSLRVIQGQGWAHDPSHVDYSQVCVLVKRECVVDGVKRDIRDVMTDPELAWLVSHDGKMSITRQPGVPEEDALPGGVPPANISGSDPFLMARRGTGEDRRVGLIAGAIGGAAVGGTVGGIPGGSDRDGGRGVPWCQTPEFAMTIQTWAEYKALERTGFDGTPTLGYPDSTLTECTCATRPHHERCPVRPPENIVLRGWICVCGIFNGEEKERRSACRCCGLARR
jgi:hypothetical protein